MVAALAESEALAAKYRRGCPKLTRSPVMRRLYELARSRGVLVYWTELLPSGLDGMYFRTDKWWPVIVLSSAMRGRLRSHVFAHVLGHYVLQHKVSVFASPATETGRRAIIQAEAQADRFARLLLHLIHRGIKGREKPPGDPATQRGFHVLEDVAPLS